MIPFSHCDESGKACMVNVGKKPKQERLARAQGMIYLSDQTLRQIKDQEIKKGSVLAVAQIAGIQAAKWTPFLIPLCHTLALDYVDIQFQLTEQGIRATSQVACVERTGAEMEALHTVTIALLTIYDMCKAVDKHMRIGEIVLIEKVKKNVNSR